jgi:SAM-dependent methyltransferase
MSGRAIDFDQYARDYKALVAAQTNFFDGDDDYFTRYKIDRLKEIAGDASAVLDFGCGIGRSMPHLRSAFPNADLVGCDPSRESLSLAREQNPREQFLSLDEVREEPRFDVVLAACVFHHIAPGDRIDAIAYCRTRLKPGGRLVIFEHNPLNPVTQRLVSTCPFDADAVLLGMSETERRLRQSGFKIDRKAYCLFFPGALAAMRLLERWLGWLPLGGQYFVSGVHA